MDHKRHGIWMLLGCGLMMVGLIYFVGSGAFGTAGGAAGEAAAKAGSASGISGWAWLLILACPLMHLFMMRGHGHGGQHCSEKAPEKSPAGEKTRESK